MSIRLLLVTHSLYGKDRRLLERLQYPTPSAFRNLHDGEIVALFTEPISPDVSCAKQISPLKLPGVDEGLVMLDCGGAVN